MIEFLLDIAVFLSIVGACALLVILFDEIVGWFNK